MTQVYSIDGIIPVVHPSSYVHPMAVLIGDVTVGRDCYIGPGASLRGDMGPVTVGDGANIQDNCVLHSYPDQPVTVEALGHIGHGAVLHGCRIGENALVGMNAVVMDGAVVGAHSVVASMAFVKAGFEVPDKTLAGGIPAKIMRALGDAEIARKRAGTGEYHALTKRCHADMKVVDALSGPPESGGGRK